MQIRNRIMEQRLVHPDEVAFNPRNWRVHPQHQRDALRGVLAEVGIVAPVIAYHSERAGGRLMLVDGHERMTVGVPFPCVILDVDDAEADKLLATFDPITSLATANAKALEELVGSFELDSQAIAEMLESLIKDAEVFKPNLAPEAATALVDEDDMAEAQQHLKEKFHGEQELIDVHCPNCYAKFYLNRSDIK